MHHSSSFGAWTMFLRSKQASELSTQLVRAAKIDGTEHIILCRQTDAMEICCLLVPGALVGCKRLQ